jgi:glycosyltransferase involved in cell wall biosynthesis
MAERLNILIITHQTVFPVNSGGAMTTMSYIEEMQKFHNLSIVITDPFVPKEPFLSELKSIWSKSKLYHTENSKPTFIFKLKEFIKKPLRKLRILKAATYTTEEYATFNYETLSYPQITLIKKILSENNFDVIEVNYVEKFPLVFALPKETLKIAVNHEPRFKRTIIQKENGKIDKKYGEYLAAYQSQFENMLMENFDSVLCLNQDDVDLVSESISKPVYLAPVSASWKDIEEISTISEPITNIFFLGSGNHYPNFDAVEWYETELGNKIYEELNIKLKVIGDWSKEKRGSITNRYISFEGFIDDLDIFAKNSIMIVPVRYGGGIRTKIQWAMSKGIPVISTQFGHEGISCEHGKNFLRAENNEDFLASIKLLLKDNDLRNSIREEGNLLIRKYFSPKIVVETRTKIYEELLLNKMVTK